MRSATRLAGCSINEQSLARVIVIDNSSTPDVSPVEVAIYSGYGAIQSEGQGTGGIVDAGCRAGINSILHCHIKGTSPSPDVA